MLGCSSNPPSLPLRPTRPLETACVLLLDLVVTLAKSILVFILSLEETFVRASFLLQQPSESFYLKNAFPWPISTSLLFSRIGKSVLDSSNTKVGEVARDESKKFA